MSKPLARGFVRARLDRLIGQYSGLPAEKCEYTSTAVRIPVTDTDGSTFELAGDLYQPKFANSSEKPCGTILVFGPYGRGIETNITLVTIFATRGYNVLFASCRGTFGSGGTWLPFRTETHDGRAIVNWMRQQAWYTGSFAMHGMSYLGFTQWAMLSDLPKDMVTAVLVVPVHDFGQFCWGTGALNMDIMVWSQSSAHMEKPSYFGPFYRMWNFLTSRGHLNSVFDGVSLVDSARKHFGLTAPWVHEIIARPDPKDPYYEPMQHRRALEVANIPILLMAGWHDIFLDQTLEQYRRLSERKTEVALIVGPWSHISVDGVNGETFAWMETHLAGHPKEMEQQRQWDDGVVRIFVGGVKEWRVISQWPPATKPLEMFLQPGQGLSEEIPTPAEDHDSTSSFTFDPRNPTPSVGGPILGTDGGCAVDDALALRSDVLTFTTDPLERDIEVLGAPSVDLAHESDNPYVDLFVRISEVDTDGHSRNVTEGYQRLDQNRPKNEPVKLTIRECAHVFRKGTRMRLIVAGGCARIYHRNPGTTNDASRADSLLSSEHTLHHGGDRVSKLVLPVAAVWGTEIVGSASGM